jgi:peptidoglycan/xylan/chitin deacetylase (PgdA/CDA1 family)
MFFSKGAIRRLEPKTAFQKTVYLTFDDGPDPDLTPKVLELLDRYCARATFFVIANRARENQRVLREIQSGGHALGNHSLDHRFGAFFKGKSRLKDWIQESESVLASITGSKSIGFRPPAGVCTPELKAALKDLEIPLFLWNVRFYDSTWGLTPLKVKSKLDKIKPGSIILLHDSQKGKHKENFLEALEYLLNELSFRGYVFNPLSLETTKSY